MQERNWSRWNNCDDVDIEEFVGKTFIRVEDSCEKGNDYIEFETADGKCYRMWHLQDCCESVDLESISGDLEWLVGTPILQGYENSESGQSAKDYWPEDVESPWPDDEEKGYWGPDSYTWTFYRITTNKGTVVLRWYGASSGYYSEGVSILKYPDKWRDEVV